MPQRHVSQAPQRRPHGPEAGPVTRNAQGLSLDDARAAFQVEWRSQIQEKERAAGRSREVAAWYGKARGVIFAGGSFFGAAFGVHLAGVFGGMTAGQEDLLTGLICGAAGGMLAATPLAVVALLCEWFWQQRAERLEREVRDLERS
jgi:hypothetical protein